jgi:hypothetical protein
LISPRRNRREMSSFSLSRASVYRSTSNLERVGWVGATRAEVAHRQVAQEVGPRMLESLEAGICQNCHLAGVV